MAKKKHRDEDDEEGTNTAVMEALEELDNEEWEDTEEGFSDLPAGTYQVKISSAAVVLSKNKGKLQIAWQFEVVSPAKFKGRKIFKYRGLVEPEDRAWAKTELAKLGVDWPKKKKLPKTLAELEETFAEIKLVDGGGDSPYKNFVKAIDEDDIDDSDSEEDDEPVKKRKKKKDADDEDDDSDDEDEKPKKKKKEEDDEDEDDDDDEPKKNKKGSDDDDDEDDSDVVCKFEEDDLEKADIKKIKKLAKSAGIDPDDYSKMVDLFGDVAEELEVSGTFKTPEKLFDAIDEAK